MHDSDKIFYKSNKCIFCFNQISYVIAQQIAKKNSGKTILLVSRNRIHQGHASAGIVFEYNSWLCFVCFLFSLITSKFEFIIPHANGGRLLRWIAKTAQLLSFIDDGMDSFRDQPKNVDMRLLRCDAPYYTFNYAIPIASWTNYLRIIRVCSLSSLLEDDRPELQLNGYQCLLVESPGVELYEHRSGYGAIFVAKHPNPHKRRVLDKKDFSSSDAVFSLEKTLFQFPGEIVVGESMALVFILSELKNLSRVRVLLHRQQFENLSALQPFLKQCAHGGVCMEDALQ